MWSNNDGMDKSYQPSPNDAFENAYAEWYNSRPDCPNAVDVKNWAHDFWKRSTTAGPQLIEAAKEVAEWAEHNCVLTDPFQNLKTAMNAISKELK